MEVFWISPPLFGSLVLPPLGWKTASVLIASVHGVKSSLRE